MTNMKSTKKALITSALCLLLCVSMLVGATFAWFTDSVSSAKNQIVAGNLDVELEWSADGNTWATVAGAANIFDPNALWEPGHTEVVYLKVSNLGTLALKYNLMVNVYGETAGTNVAGKEFKLSDYLVFKAIEMPDALATLDNREAAQLASGSAMGLKDYNGETTALEANGVDYVALIVYMPETVGNEANYRGEAVPTIELGVNLFATQYTYEKDSYGSDYDAAAKPVVVYTAEELAAALTSDEEIISVILGNDINVPITSLGNQTPGSGEYKLGGENTEAITIDLNGNKLNITTNYWSGIGAKNADATITIKNGSMTSSQPTGTWNSYDLTFSNCNYVLENVTFEKAIALCNEGKTATLKNVTINETHDYYALWITAEGQNVSIDGLTVNSLGRGIKIDEQYVDAPAKVTLSVSNATFNTNKKAAIMVKSADGADITLSSVNIANTPDAAHAVWVDEESEAYYDLVTVTGGKKIYEGDIITSASDLQDALDAALNSGEDVVLGGNLKFNASETTANSGYGATGVSVNGTTLDGNGYSLGINDWGTWDAAVHTTGGTIKNLTINSGMRGIFMGSATADVYIDNVTIDGTIYTFNSDGGSKDYGVYISNSTLNGWTSHSDVHKEVVYTNCNFGEGQGYAFCRPYGPTQFVGCNFAAGFEVDAVGVITFENCTINGEPLTAENLATLVTSNIANASVIG